ncbi:predicted protein [Naegleria gruberi]|uniref:Predicted protein n=1 Tax=Naegleria gruberi TaxID=5762 RepID=D2VZB6_NAEGR|nr:uncharacterized protein NAEGRDRAFT_74433 [Naegleria gruberi]EFC37763.1 predicted protein [Naegleria gruberi]|eukprot:XP_002670507.1 predicted protein [Naegleria gruberi strain NEG-M]
MSESEEPTAFCILDDHIKSEELIQNYTTIRNEMLEIERNKLLLVVIGCLRDTNNNFTRFQMACYDKSCGKFVTVCSLSVGFTQELKQEISERLSKLIIPSPSANVIFNEKQPAQVWFANYSLGSKSC